MTTKKDALNVFPKVGLLSPPPLDFFHNNVLSESLVRTLPCRLIHKIKSSALNINIVFRWNIQWKKLHFTSLKYPQNRLKNHGRLRNDQGIDA